MPNVVNPESSRGGPAHREPRPDDLRRLKLGARGQPASPTTDAQERRTPDAASEVAKPRTSGDWVEPGQSPPSASGSEWVDPRDQSRESAGDSNETPWQRLFGGAGAQSEALQLGKPPSHLKRLAAHIIDCVIITAALSVVFPAVLGVPYLDIDTLRMWFEEVIAQANLAQSGSTESAPSVSSTPDSIPIRSPGINVATGLTLAAYVLYHGVLLGVVGTTVGKRLFGISVCGPDGLPIGIPRGVIRSVGLYLTTTFAAVGFLVVLFHPRRRALHDMISGSHPIERAPSYERVDQT